MILEVMIEYEIKQNAEDAEHTQAMHIECLAAKGFPRSGIVLFGSLRRKEVSNGANEGGSKRKNNKELSNLTGQ